MQRLIGTLSAALLVAVTAASALAQEKAAPAAGTAESGAAQRRAVLAVLTQLETGFNTGDAKSLAACWTENGEFVGPSGTRADGREDIQKQFQEAFAAHRTASKLKIHVNHVRLVGENLALVEAVPEVKSAADTGGAPVSAFVLVKQGDRWLIASARETIMHLPPQTNHLKELEWLIGEWSSETSSAGITLHTNCSWTADRAFLIRKFKVEGKGTILHGGTEVIAWDPRNGRIRSWVFDADGGFGENVWVHDGKRWLIKYSGTLADGSEASATHILNNVDADTLTLQSRDRVVNGAAEPDIPETTLKRQAEAKPPVKTEEVKPPAKDEKGEKVEKATKAAEKTVP